MSPIFIMGFQHAILLQLKQKQNDIWTIKSYSIYFIVFNIETQNIHNKRQKSFFIVINFIHISHMICNIISMKKTHFQDHERPIFMHLF